MMDSTLKITGTDLQGFTMSLYIKDLYLHWLYNIVHNSFDFEYEGFTTSSFDSVKQFYLDVYEALGNLMIIPIALNNIKYRN